MKEFEKILEKLWLSTNPMYLTPVILAMEDCKMYGIKAVEEITTTNNSFEVCLQ